MTNLFEATNIHKQYAANGDYVLHLNEESKAAVKRFGNVKKVSLMNPLGVVMWFEGLM